MIQRSLIFIVAAGGLLASTAVAAEISYGYNATLLPQGRIDGSFRASEAAIADGSITADEVTASFVLSAVTVPFVPTTFTTPELNSLIFTPHSAEVYVDRVSGKILDDDFSWSALDSDTGQRLGMTSHSIGVSSGTNSIGVETPVIVSGGGPGAGSGGPGGGPGANITYTYASTSAAPQAGQLSGSFVVPKAAIVDGIITFTEISSASFILTGSTAPFTPRTITLSDFVPLFKSPGHNGEVRVNPTTGAFLEDFYLYTFQLLPNNMNIELFPHRYIVNASDGGGARVRGLGSFTVSGGGTPAGGGEAVAVPLLSPFVMAVLTTLLALFGAILRRRSPGV